MKKLAIIMDPLDTIKPHKDTSLAILASAQKHGFTNHYIQQHDLFVRDGVAHARCQQIQVNLTNESWYELEHERIVKLEDFDVILMRKDPPFDMQYIYTTYILELAEKSGTLVVNKPQSLRDYNEKVFTSLFPNCIPESLITRSRDRLLEFASTHQEIILKPLDSMGGTSIFKTSITDANLNVIIETLTDYQTKFIMAQRFIPEIANGDKRIILINGKPINLALARIPPKNDFRGNMAVGATTRIQPLTKRDYFICEQIAPTLIANGLIFVGIDVIGDYLTEINVTSPTGIRELATATQTDIAGQLITELSTLIAAH